MPRYRHGVRMVFEVHLHIVWTTKYRKPMLSDEVGARARELLQQVCDAEDVQLHEARVAADHVHLFVSIPPQAAIGRLVQRLKGRSSHALMMEFEHVRRTFWKHVWERGYFCCSSGDVTDEGIKAYIEDHDHEPPSSDGAATRGAVGSSSR